VNSEAAAVAGLNAQIRQARGTGAEPNDLLDLRQQHLDKLAELVGATMVPTSEGDVNVTLPGGVTLVAGDRAGSLTAVPDATNGGHLQLMLQLPDGSPPTALANAGVGGTLGGSLAARDGTLLSTGQDIDHLAADLAQTVNDQHALGFQRDGSAGQPVFGFGAGWAGAAGRMSLLLTSGDQLALAASAAGASGDAGNANALVATSQAALATSGKAPADAVADVVSRFGSSSSTAKAFSEQDAAMKDNLTAMRESVSGVSIDEEMITLQQAQRGYEAIAKVIQTADEMLQTLLAIKPV
jgi:flagellar hook-associated protein 1 FlgK